MTTSPTSRPPCEPFSRSAEFYDVIHRYKNYAEEARQVRAFLGWFRSTTPRRMLDLGCGTARFSRAMADGFERIVAVDPSAAMIQAARAAGPLPPNVHLSCGTLGDLPDVRFDSAICMFGAMSYATADESLADQLRKIRSLMEPGGRIVFDVVNLLCCCLDFHRHSVTEHQLPDGRVLRREMRKTLDCRESLVWIEIQFSLAADPAGGEVIERWTEHHRMRAFSPREIADAMTMAGFAHLTICQPPDPADVREIYTIGPTDYYCWAAGSAV